MNPFFQLTLAVAVSMLVIPLIRRVAPRFGLVDLPDPRKVHLMPIPRVGGWGITAGLLLPLLLIVHPDPLLQSFMIGCTVLFVFGVWDDAHTISHWPKFLGQVIATGVVVYYGDLWVSRLPYIDAAIPAAFGKPFTMFALIGVINAINHSDGLDGLAGGESVLSLIALAILGYMSGKMMLVSVSLAAVGGIFGFLRYNSHPAYVFMGDCGSQVLGFTLGFLVVYLTQVANPALSAAIPLLILGLPIADILSVLYQRIHGGMNWFKATRNHVHHRLLAIGFNHYETVVVIYLLQAAFVVSAVLARYESDAAVTTIYAAGIVGVFSALWSAERRQWRVPRGRIESSFSHFLDVVKRSRFVADSPLLLITVLTPLVMLCNAFWAARVPTDFAVTAAVLALLPATLLFWPQAMQSLVLRLGVYAAAIFPAYLVVSYPEAVPQNLQVVIFAVLVVLALAVVMYARFGGRERFGATPTDYLIVCGVVALSVFGSIEANSHAVVEAVLLTTVLSYACEVIVGTAPQSTSRLLLRWSTLGSLLIIALRGVK